MQLQKRRKRQKIQHSFGDTGNHGVLFKSIWSWERSLVEWASVTDAFDSIVVILEVSSLYHAESGTYFFWKYLIVMGLLIAHELFSIF